jgi:hypothetical protein
MYLGFYVYCIAVRCSLISEDEGGREGAGGRTAGSTLATLFLSFFFLDVER